MIKVSELLSKRLISLANAEVIGTISNIVFDSKLERGRLLKIYNDDDTDITTRFVELKKVKNLEFDAAVINDKSFVSALWNTDGSGIINPINSECFNQDGKALGVVKDITLDGTLVTSILVGEKEFLPKQLLSYSEKLLIFNDTGKPVKLPKAKTEVPTALGGEQIATVHGEQTVASNILVPTKVSKENTVVVRSAPVDAAPDRESEQPRPLPPVQQPAYSFLLGKTVSRDIKSQSGETLILAGTTVNENILELAKKNGRLVQLALHAE